MKTDTASVRVENRVGEQVVDIDQNPRQENDGRFGSLFLEKAECNEYGNQKMNSVMKNKPKHSKSSN